MIVRRAFSLIELILVVTVLAALLSLLLPAVQASRAAARRSVCRQHLKELSLAGLSFHSAQGHFPPGLDQAKFTTPPIYRGTSLFAFLLPYVEESNLARDWDYERPLANAEGALRSRAATCLAVYLCPSDDLDATPVRVGDNFFGRTSYGGNGGSRSYYPDLATTDGIFHTTGPASDPLPDQCPIMLSEVLDGTSHTLLFGERSHRDDHWESFVESGWAESLEYLGRWSALGGKKRIGDVTLSTFAPLNYRLPFDFEGRDMVQPALNGSRDFQYYEDLRVCAYGSEHAGGVHVAFVDGCVRFLSNGTSDSVLQAAGTRAGEELVHEP